MRNTYVTISGSAIRANIRATKKIAGNSKICCVIKADAYGHGMVPVAKILSSEGVDYFAVALTDEAVELRTAGIIEPILVMGAIEKQSIEICIKNNISITVSSVEKLKEIERVARESSIRAVIHIKIDTGMGRVGIHFDRAFPLIEYAHQLQNENIIFCEGIYSHFADSADADFSELQFNRLMNVIDQAKNIGLEFSLQHISNSLGIILHPEYHLSMIRPGIMLYGIEPEQDTSVLNDEFEPVLSWKTSVAYFKVVHHGETVGYTGTWTPADEYARVITLPVGYADGFPRRLSNKGSVIVNGKKYPIVGRVSMDQSTVSLGMVGEAYLGDEVILIGKGGEQEISVQDIARLIDTTPHEITTTITARVRRVIIDG
jgi:alanine racemase